MECQKMECLSNFQLIGTWMTQERVKTVLFEASIRSNLFKIGPNQKKALQKDLITHSKELTVLSNKIKRRGFSENVLRHQFDFWDYFPETFCLVLDEFCFIGEAGSNSTRTYSVEIFKLIFLEHFEANSWTHESRWTKKISAESRRAAILLCRLYNEIIEWERFLCIGVYIEYGRVEDRVLNVQWGWKNPDWKNWGFPIPKCSRCMYKWYIKYSQNSL